MSLDSRLVNLAAVGRKLLEQGLVRGTSGSVSLRWEEQCFISPAGARLDRLGAADFIPLFIQGNNTWQVARASGELSLHLACYRARPDAMTVVHVHPPNCIALGCAGLSLGAITPDFYRAVGPEAPLLPYLAPQSQALADAVGQAIAEHNALLLRNQGLVLVATGSDEALAHCEMVEEAARMVLLAHAAAGACSFLTAEQMEELELTTGRVRRP